MNLYLLRSLRLTSLLAPAAAVAIVLAGCSSSSSPSGPGDADGGDPKEDAAPADATPAIDSSWVDTGGPQQVPDSAAANEKDGSSDSASAADAADTSSPSSPYAVSCTAASMTCPGTPLVCQKFGFGGGAINGYACTKTCTIASDCGTSPPGFPPLQCDAFTTGGFCVLSCDPNSATSCPSPLKCAANSGQAKGICVSF